MIKQNYVFVLGKVSKIESTGDAINFCFKYKFQKITFNECISTIDPVNYDSLIWIKISTVNPELFEKDPSIVPEYIIKKPNFDTCWTTLP
ncbi:MAG: hypothetical protein IPG89_13075 [Bacteroidetes bacterium]|nr:hypothetical protein [Bacteroidota bacterium]